MIPVKNIYYMLSYAFEVLKDQGYKDLAAEEFDNAAELCAAILARGIGYQLKRGLGRQYQPYTEPLSSLRGKIDISESIRTLVFQKRQMVCTYDQLSEDTELNRIIKSTAQLLMKANISRKYRNELHSCMTYFTNVAVIDLRSANWKPQYDRNNHTYRLLINVCWLVYKGLLQTQKDGTIRLNDFLDGQEMHHLYEKFVLNYYKIEHPELKAAAPEIEWQEDNGYRNMLPKMHTDITLTKGTDILIIDTKYYSHTMQEHYGKETFHSGNLYQIFTYVKNKEYELAGKEHTVSGMLLYAKTDEDIFPNESYMLSGNRITIRTLDLNVDFAEIRKQLDGIAEKMFGT